MGKCDSSVCCLATCHSSVCAGPAGPCRDALSDSFLLFIFEEVAGGNLFTAASVTSGFRMPVLKVSYDGLFFLLQDLN